MNYLMILILSTFGLNTVEPISNELNTSEKIESKNSNGDRFDVKVIITNVKVDKGYILIGIYDVPNDYLKDGKAYSFTTHKVKANGNQTEVILKDIPKGTYAISLCQDINGDKKCNTNFFGIPQEPYGFSNGYNKSYSKPSFNDCKFEVNDNKTVKVQLIH